MTFTLELSQIPLLRSTLQRRPSGYFAGIRTFTSPPRCVSPKFQRRKPLIYRARIQTDRVPGGEAKWHWTSGEGPAEIREEIKAGTKDFYRKKRAKAKPKTKLGRKASNPPIRTNFIGSQEAMSCRVKRYLERAGSKLWHWQFLLIIFATQSGRFLAEVRAHGTAECAA